MKCSDCLGKGFFYRYEVLMDDDGENPVLGTATHEPCRTCGGYGQSYCCEGEVGGEYEPRQVQGTADNTKTGTR